jgi:ABC-type sugar transport system substrate-binding protein
MDRKKGLWLLALGLLLVFGVATNAVAADKVFRVGFSNIADSDANCLQATQTFVNIVQSPPFQKAVGSKVQVKALNTDSNLDLAAQTSNIETLITQGVDLMFIIGVDTEGNSTAVKACNDAGIPVFMVATEATEGAYKFIGFNETQFGQAQGQYVVDNLKKGGTVLYLSGTPGREASIAREKGSLDLIKAKRSDIKILSSQTGDFKEETAMKVTEDWIQAYGGKFDAIVAADNSMALGAIEALKAAKLLSKVQVVGCIVPGTWDADLVKSGEMAYGVFVSFKTLGELCAQVAQDWYTTKKIPDKSYMKMWDVTLKTYSKYFGK